MSLKRLSFVFFVEGNDTYTGVPNHRLLPNSYDYLGQLVGLSRLPNESNVPFRDRILDVMVNPAGPTYTGLVNGIYRELGLSKFDAIRISPVYATETETVGRSPVIEVKATKLILYEAWWGPNDYVVDREIKFYNRTDPGYFLGDLVNLINESLYFSAIRLYDDAFLPSQYLLRDRTVVQVKDEVVPASFQIRLKNTNLVNGSLRIRDLYPTYQTTANRNMSSSNSSNYLSFMFNVTTPLTVEGQYTVDTDEGILTFFSLPSGQGLADYMYFDYPWTLKASDVAVFGLGEEDFFENLFEKVEDRFGEEHLGLPTIEGSDYIQELYRNVRIIWGR